MFYSRDHSIPGMKCRCAGCSVPAIKHLDTMVALLYITATAWKGTHSGRCVYLQQIY